MRAIYVFIEGIDSFIWKEEKLVKAFGFKHSY